MVNRHLAGKLMALSRQMDTIASEISVLVGRKDRGKEMHGAAKIAREWAREILKNEAG